MQSRADYYEIIIEGHIDHHRLYLADNISAEYLAGGTTRLLGQVDQAALQGILGRICDLGLPLLSVTRKTNHEEEVTK